jgi:BirA family biotin operon repressor/biotin-[acetyl-CoA-carboxylase] ligase
MSDVFSKFLFNSLMGSRSSQPGSIRWNLLLFEQLSSTSTFLVERIKQGYVNDVVVAEVQTAGRGRRGNVWYSSDKGNLYVSASFELSGDAYTLLPLVPLSAGVAAATMLRECGLNELCLKWPNDLLVGEKKLGGILCEAPFLSKDRIVTAVGLGINVVSDSFPKEIDGRAVSVKRYMPVEFSREQMVFRWLVLLEELIDEVKKRGPDLLVDRWRKYGEPFGRRVKVGSVCGTTVDLNSNGRLLIKSDSGKIIDIAGGIVENIDLFD